MTALSRRRDPLDPPRTVGEWLWLARCAHPLLVPSAVWSGLALLGAAVVAVAS